MGEAADQVRGTGNTAGTGAASAAQHAQSPALDSADTGQIRSEIEQTRSDMSQTIGALQDKLDPSHIADQVQEELRGRAADAYQTAKTAVKEATLGRVERAASTLSEKVGSVGAQVSSVLQDGGSKLKSASQRHPLTIALTLAGAGAALLLFRGNGARVRKSSRAAKDGEDLPGGTTAASAVAGREDHGKTAHGGRAAGDALRELFQDKPLVVGFAALAAGAILGINLPPTEWEDDYLGETRQRLFEHAQGVAHEATQRLHEAAGEVGKSVVDSIRGEISRGSGARSTTL